MELETLVEFHVNGVKSQVDASNFSSGTTLNTYLRDHLLLTGTKKMCEEGGCGVCVVAVTICGDTKIRAVNSCLVSIFSCHGWHIYTIEGLGNSERRNVIQEALIRFNGSQCGYCTPGMVMNMYALRYSSENLTMKTVENSFGGNICRCTGYRPILSAFKSLCDDATADLKACLTDIEDLRSCSETNTVTRGCHSKARSPFYFLPSGETWIKVFELNDLLQVMRTFSESDKGDNGRSYALFAGNTAKGVYKNKSAINVSVDISNITELVGHQLNENTLVLGANITLTDTMAILLATAKTSRGYKYLEKLADHIDLVANVPVRNIGTLAGNLMMKHQHKSFPSDIFLILAAVDARLEIVDYNNKTYHLTAEHFLATDMSNKIIHKIHLPVLDNTYKFESYKIMPRKQNAHALVNAGFLLKLSADYTVESARIVFGCINENFVRAIHTETYLKGKPIFDNEVLQIAFQKLDEELICDHAEPDSQPKFRNRLAISLFYKYVLSIAPIQIISHSHKSGRSVLDRPVSRATQDYETEECLYPLARSTSKIEAKYQVTGEAEYVLDMPNLPNQLFAAFVLAQATPGSRIIKCNPDKALKLKGVKAFFDKSSIPGKNYFGKFMAPPVNSTDPPPPPVEEELFCSGKVLYHSQPIGIVVATSQMLAQHAAELVEISYANASEKPFVTIQDVLERGNTGKIQEANIILPSRKGTSVINEICGKYNMSWQYHFHMETQCCNAVPTEEGLHLYPTTQWMDLCQRSAATVLNIPVHKIDVSVKRLGGGFGAKIARIAMVASAAAIAAHLLKKPVKLWMPLETNISVMGKRYPILSHYKVGVDETGLIQYLENEFYYDHGCGGNEQCLMLLLDIYTGVYKYDTWQSNAKLTTTDTAANAYTRAPGSLEGFGMIESIMEHAAMEIGMDPWEFKVKNIDPKHNQLKEHINDFIQWAEIDKRRKDITKFNQENNWKKKGLSISPMIYPFELWFAYEAIVSIYHADGTVSIAHGGVEVGQGINTKAVEACAYKLGIPIEKINVKSSNTLIAPNSHMTGASIASEGVCWAIMKACDILLERMEPIKKKMAAASWEEIVEKCYEEMVHLSASSMVVQMFFFNFGLRKLEKKRGVTWFVLFTIQLHLTP
ncbi:xanthine dehydrogenase-like isoform X2 [Cylas formicarius]|uniref:xanthine dehydrogenase-like isoform X2 n=1 Tax=Cylas formicarius TaxID=197179 RepID=UPI0029589166|nr:xanthine dehydrogenase-like isoform X2 [Cylas formicarius]